MSRRRNPELLLLSACLCSLLVAGRAWALNSDKSQPINVHSDNADYKEDPKNAGEGTGIYSGHVIITQGSIVLRGDKAVLHMVGNDLSSADVTGNPVTFEQHPDQGEPMYGESQELTYDAAKNEITFITNAKLSQQVLQNPAKGPNTGAAPGQRLMTADVIHYNTDTQHVVAKGGDEQQRVHVSFPPKTAAPASGTAHAAAPATGRKSLILPPPAGRAPTTLGAPPQAPAAASTAAPAAATQPGNDP